METVNAFARNVRRFQYLLLLNDDLHPSGPFLAPLLDALESRSVSAVAPSVWRLRPSMTESVTSFLLRRGLYWPQPGVLRHEGFHLPYLPATALLLRTAPLPEPLFPEVFAPGYAEDIALSFHLRIQGGFLRFVPTPPLLHEGGQSFRRYPPRHLQRLFLRNLLLLHALAFGETFLHRPWLRLRRIRSALWREAHAEALSRLPHLPAWHLQPREAKRLFESPDPL